MMITMSVFLVLTFLYLSFPMLADDCKPTSCNKNGPTIHFPFRNIHLHPADCGHPGFDVFCNEKNETVLVLPLSVRVAVQKIDYVSQQLDLYDPGNCFAKTLVHLNLSASPFYFTREYYLFDFVLFNCSDPKSEDLRSEYAIPCLDDSGYLFAVWNNNDVDFFPWDSCTIVREIPSVPLGIFHVNVFQLKWSKPTACSRCEHQGKRCSLNNSPGGMICVDKNHEDSEWLLVAGSCIVLIILAAVALSIRAGKENHLKIKKFLEDYRALKPTRFSYSDIRRITLNFSEKLGEGGYGTVYKGRLSNAINVAVKVLHNSKGNGEEFVNEVSTIGQIHHVNVVRLIGFCAQGDKRALVYEFQPNHSLEKFIFQSSCSKTKTLGWQMLRDIALGIAKGIDYLHEGCDHQILHFDIKPHNILLDQNFNPKICDFGMAKLCSKEQSAVTMTAARGTMGYIAPEVLSRTFGRVSYKSDVYSFGMLLLEMVGGRKNIDPNKNMSQVYFPQWVYNRLDTDFGEEFWAQIEEGEDGNIARRLTIVGLWCIQWCPSDRPCMKDVIQMLEGDEESLTIPPNPFPATNSVIIPGRHYQTELPLILEQGE